jgi:hydrogenase maturation protease
VTTSEIAFAEELEQRMPLRSHSSTHGFGVFEALELARILGTIPERLTVIGIEGSHFGPGAELTPELEDAASQVADLILRSAAEQKV